MFAVVVSGVLDVGSAFFVMFSIGLLRWLGVRWRDGWMGFVLVFISFDTNGVWTEIRSDADACLPLRKKRGHGKRYGG
jgi:hypothetical protein